MKEVSQALEYDLEIWPRKFQLDILKDDEMTLSQS